jgi:DNA (cytosine-5)-methyltransferase 1
MNNHPVYNHQARKVNDTVLQRIKALKVGQKMQDLPEELWHDSFRFYVKEDPTRQGGPNLRMIRLDPHQPALTVTGFIYNKFVHPYEDRFITPREAARLQGFPDDLEFKGSLTSVQRQVGDAVPLELGRALFQQLGHYLLQMHPPQKDFRALSLFSGAGGLDIAAHQSSKDSHFTLQTVACVEIDKDRCDTLRGYFGTSIKIIQADISDLTPYQVLSEVNMLSDAISLVYGGPPCQSFSQAGKQQGIYDPRGELLFDFLRFVKEINPPFFLMENVANLKSIHRGILFQAFLDTANTLGYDVDYRVLNSAYFGNAQKRQRLICFGSRRDISILAKLPEPTHTPTGNLFGTPSFKTVAEAFAGLPPIARS